MAGSNRSAPITSTRRTTPAVIDLLRWTVDDDERAIAPVERTGRKNYSKANPESEGDSGRF
jgi:hypothetical protein